MTTYYKVLHRCKDGKLLSIRNLLWGGIDYCGDMATVEYKVGEFVEPTIKNSKLYCFPQLDNVRSFISPLLYYRNFIRYIEIYACEVKNPLVCSLICESLNPTNILSLFWNGGFSYFKIPPRGTIECDSIKLLQKVNIYE